MQNLEENSILSLKAIKDCTETSFMYSGGASFQTHVLQTKTKIIKFRPTLNFVLYTLMYFGLSVLCYFIGINLLPIDNGLSALGFVVLGASLVFGYAFFYFLKDFLVKIVFSKETSSYYKGYLNLYLFRYDTIKLDEIVAIQVLGEITSETIAPFNSFELNLVLKDCERIHVIDHSNLKTIINDATALSEFLDVPIWTNES